MADGQPQTFTIPGVEILRTGTWNGRDYTTADLDDIASAHEALKASGFLVPRVTIDHSERATRSQGDGGPALGFVDTIERIGDRLIASLIKVPAMLASAIQRENYQPRSVEIWWDVELGGTEFPAVLSVLSFLGADLPAVDGLAAIEQLYAEQPEAVTALSIEETGKTKRSVVRLSALPESEPTLEPSKMEASKILEALGLAPDASEEAIMAHIADLVGTKEENAAEDEADAADPADEPAAEEAVKETLALKNDNATLLARVTKLEKEAAQTTADAAVDGLVRAGRLLPKQRGQWTKLCLQDPALFSAMSADLEVQVDLGEHGHSSAPEADEFAPSKDELAAALKVDPTLTADDIRAEKARRAGKTITTTVSQES